MIGFMKSVSRMPIHWRVWITLLVSLNFFVPLLFIEHMEAQIVVASMVAGFLTQTYIHLKLGFVKLLGLGHVFWIPLIVWLVASVDIINFQTYFGVWLISLIVINIVSLVIDIVDVLRFVLGERSPTLIILQDHNV